MPDRYATPAGGKSVAERAGLYALALQEREDEGGEQGPLLVAKRTSIARKSAARDANTLDGFAAAVFAMREAEGKST